MSSYGGEHPKRFPDKPGDPRKEPRGEPGDRDERTIFDATTSAPKAGGATSDAQERSRRGLEDLGEETMADLRGFIERLDEQRERGKSNPTPPLQSLGPYTDLVEIGRGGMGVVYRARDPKREGFVALKIPASDWTSDPSLRPRFLREARIVGELDHPGILPYFDSGEIDGRCYIVGEYCDGMDLAAWLKGQEAPVPPRAAANLVAALAEAVAHAHDRGVLHRDLKPSNVLLPGATETTDPMALRPRLTDFGLAKLVDPTGDDEGAATQALTRTGVLLGSPPYMAPEQAAGDTGSFGPWTDIYGLGTILYEALTGRPPFRGETPNETLRLVREADPIPVRELRGGAPRALETITLKCLEKAPEQRYASAALLADDLRRFIDGRTIRAKPATTPQRLRRWARRRPRIAGSIAAGLIGLAVIICGVVVWNFLLREAYREILRQRERADQNVHDSNLQLAAKALEAEQLGRAELILHDMIPPAGEVDRRDFAWGHLWRLSRSEARLISAGATSYSGLCLCPGGRRLALTDDDGSIRLIDLASERAIWSNHAEPSARFLGPAFSSDGRLLAVGVGEEPGEPWRDVSKVELRSADTGEILSVAVARQPGWIQRITFLNNDTLLGIHTSIHNLAGERFNRFSTWEIGRGTTPPARPRSTSAVLKWLDVAPDGTFYAAPGDDGRPMLFDAATNAPRSMLADAPAQIHGRAFFAPDGDRVAMVHGDELFVWETASGRLLHHLQVSVGAIKIVALQSGGGAILVGGTSEEVRLIDPSRDLNERIFGPGDAVFGVVTTHLLFTPDGTRFVVNRTVHAEPDRIQLRSAIDGALVAESPGRQLGFLERLIFQRDGAGAGEPTLIYDIRRYLWRWSLAGKLSAPAVDRVVAHNDEIWDVEYSPDGSIRATGGDDEREPRTIKLWDARTGRLLLGWKGHEATVTDLAFSPDGRRLASSSLAANNPVRVWECPSGRELASLTLLPGEEARAVRFDPTGLLLAAGGNNGTLRVWDARNFAMLWERPNSGDRLHDVVFNPRGDRIASASELGFIRVHNVRTMDLLFEHRSPGTVLTLAYDPLGRFLAAGDREGSILLFDAVSNQLIRKIRSDDRQLFGLAFSPDGKTLAVGGHGRSIRLYDPETGNELLTLAGHKAQVNSLTFSPDGLTLASADHEGVVFLWRADRGPAPGEAD